MKLIAISEDKLDELFQKCLDECELTKHREHGNAEEKMRFSELHRKFHYQVCVLKDKIKEEM